MKTLTIRQPHVAAIFAGLKRFETRSWPTKYRGPLAIHAGAALDKGALALAEKDGLVELPRGAVVGTVELVDCIPADLVPRKHRRWGIFTSGRWAFDLRVTEIFKEAVPAKGWLSLWEWPKTE